MSTFNDTDEQENKLEEWRLELLKWLIDRADSLRQSYNNRAAVILSADALVLATIAFVLDKTPANHIHIFYVKALGAISLVFMFASFVLSFKASLSFWHDSSRATKFGEDRYFFNARTTTRNKKFDDFKTRFNSASLDEFLSYGYAQLWASYLLQMQRYASLKAANLTLLIAITTLMIAIVLAFFI